MRTMKAAAVASFALALAGCASEEDRREAAKASFKATLEASGFSSVVIGSDAGDGVERLVLSNVTAKGPGGTSISVRTATFLRPELDPMMVKWHDLGPIEVAGWQIYGGYSPKPKGFRAESLSLEGIALAADGLPVRVAAAEARVNGYDTSEGISGRYGEYSLRGAEVSIWDEVALAVDEAKGAASDWSAGGAWALSSDVEAKGTVALPARAKALVPAELQGPFAFQLTSSSDLDPEAGSMSGGIKVALKGLGEFATELEMGGFTMNLLKAAASAQEQAVHTATKGPKGKDKAMDTAAAMEEFSKAARSLSLIRWRLEASGLEWLGPVLDRAGGREAWVNLVIPTVDRSFGGSERSARADAALAAMALFLRDPSAFAIELRPPEPFVLSGKGASWYANPASPVMEEFGFAFENRPTKDRE